MEIDEKGLKMTSGESFLAEFVRQFQSKYGSDFYIKPEGVIDNIASVLSVTNFKIEEQISELAKQFDPETASGSWQNALYGRIGVSRLSAQKTTFVRLVHGSPNLQCEAGSITIRSLTDKNEYINTTSFMTDDQGDASVDFECVLEGAISVSADDVFEIVTAPDGVSSTSSAEDMQLVIGRAKETDDEFRVRFRNSKALNAKATRNANEANLSKYVDNIAYLKILDKKTDENFDVGTLKIIAHHNTTDNIFARAIFDSVADGIELLGDTEVALVDDAGQPVYIKFKNAELVNISIKADVKVRKGYYPSTVFAKAKNNVLDYIKERVFGIESVVYATEFIIPILETDGVEAVQNIKVKSAEGEYLDSVAMSVELKIFLYFSKEWREIYKCF